MNKRLKFKVTKTITDLSENKTETRTMTYDEADRMTQLAIQGQAPTHHGHAWGYHHYRQGATTTTTETITLNYDTNGNLISDSTGRQITLNALDQLTRLSHQNARVAATALRMMNQHPVLRGDSKNYTKVLERFLDSGNVEKIDAALEGVMANNQQSTTINLMLENAEIRKALDEPTPSDVVNYPRPVTQLEEKLVDHMIQDLVHPEADLAAKAKDRLKQLGVSEDSLNQLTEKLKMSKPNTKNVQFGMKIADTDVIKTSDLFNEVKQHIYSYNPPEKILNPGVDHQLETLHYSVDPILFGATRTIIDPDGHVKYINITENLPQGCQEL